MFHFGSLTGPIAFPLFFNTHIFLMSLSTDSATLPPRIFYTKKITLEKHKVLCTKIYIPLKHIILSNLKKKGTLYTLYFKKITQNTRLVTFSNNMKICKQKVKISSYIYPQIHSPERTMGLYHWCIGL